MPVEISTGGLPTRQKREVARLASAAEAVDSAPPLSDTVLLAGDPAAINISIRLDDRLIGYACVEPEDLVIEIVVDPEYRGQGVGAQLLTSAIAAGGRQLWTRGDREMPHQLARRAGMTPVRHLWCMRRSLEADAGDLSDRVPPPYRFRSFEGDLDTDDLLEVNAAAFTELPDQGSWDRDDIAARQQAQWFDPDDIILLVDGPRLDGFHWTKVHPDGVTGEVYVLALHPRAQGRGLAGPLLEKGLTHLAGRGCASALLYVDEDNRGARRLYRGHGFVDERLDVLYRCS